VEGSLVEVVVVEIRNLVAPSMVVALVVVIERLGDLGAVAKVGLVV
jgi:hypothetical protein